MTIKVAVVGATGRMGKLALDLINSAQDLSLHASLHSRSSLSELDGADVGRLLDHLGDRQGPVGVRVGDRRAADLAQ